MKLYEFSPVIVSRFVSAEDIVLPKDIKFRTCELCGADEQVIWDEFEPCFECETITSRRQLPDLMLYGGGIVNSFGDWCLVSKRVKNLFEKEKFKGAEFYPAKLFYTRRKDIFDIDEPYYVMFITGRADYDFKKMNVEISICRRCGRYLFDAPEFPLSFDNPIYPTLVDEKSWDGSDVFNDMVCTEQFARSILEHGLTGFQFLPLEFKYDKFENRKYIEKLSGLK